MKQIKIENKMKYIVLLLVTFFILNSVMAQQDTTIVSSSTPEKKHTITGTIELSIGNDKKENTPQEGDGDTTKIRMGKKEIVIVETGGNRTVDILKSDDDWKRRENDNDDNKFDGHWAGIDLGVNGFAGEDYSMYGGTSFMDLNQTKSLEVSINFWEYDIRLQQEKNNIGLVTGMGLTYNNYRFDDAYSIQKEDGIIVPVSLDDDGLKKSKLTVTYLTVPLMLEFQIPVNDHSNNLFISGGIEGGLNIGSHTKVKGDDKKEKERDNFYLNTFKYQAVGRIGLKHVCLYASYNLNPLFKEDRGPELTPFTVGIRLIKF